MVQLVVLDGYTLNPGDNPWTELEALGNLVVHDRTPPGDVVARARGADVVLTNKTPLDGRTLEQLPGLRGVCVLATGVNVVDVTRASALGISVCNIPAYSTQSTAQHTIALLLELTNRVGAHDHAVHEGAWTTSRDFSFTLAPLVELAGLTLGVVGFGAIGAAVAQIARALGMQVIAAGEPRVSDPEFLRRMPVDELFRNADVVTLHCPLTEQTRGLVNAARLSSMRSSALLINAARGPLVDEADLADALARRVIAGAALDVLSQEPPSADNPLLTAPRCVITPHHAWATLAARRRALRIAAENVRGLLRGMPQNVVNNAV